MPNVTPGLATPIAKMRRFEASARTELRPLPPTQTPGRAVDRSVMVDAPTPIATAIAPRSIAGDRGLKISDRSADSVFVLGLGPLAPDAPRLRARLTRMVQAHGLREMKRRIASARDGARHAMALAARTNDAVSVAHAGAIDRRLRILDAHADVIAEERAAVEAALTPLVLHEAEQILEAARRQVTAYREAYFSSGREPALQSLRDDSATLVAARTRALRHHRSASSSSGRTSAHEAYADVLRTVSARHPILACFDLGSPEFSKLVDLSRGVESRVAGGTPIEVERALDEPLRSMLDEIESATNAMQSRLQDDPTIVWRLGAVAEATLVRHDIPGHGMVAAHVRDITRDAKSDDALWQNFVSVAAFGLGIAAALPSGGTSVTAAAAVAATVDAYQLYEAVERYRFETAASGTDLDRRAAMSPDAPNVLGLVVDGAAALSGAAGTIAALSKARFARALGRTDAVGDAARTLDLRLGRTPATALFAQLGEVEMAALQRAVDGEVWSALALVDADDTVAALEALGPKTFAAWSQKLGASRFANLVDRVPQESWTGLVAADVAPDAIAAAVDSLGVEVIRRLTPSLKGRGLVTLASRLDGAAVDMTAGGHLLIDGRFLVHPQRLIGHDASALTTLRATWSALVEKAPALAEVAMISRADIAGFERLRSALVASDDGAVKSALGSLRKTGAPKSTLLRIGRELAGTPVRLGSRAEAIVSAAPQLRGGLDTLIANTRISSGLRARALDGIESALASKSVHFSRRHLDDLVTRGAAKVEHPDRQLEAALFELEYALEVVRDGRAAADSTLYIGAKAGERVTLAHGGPVVELPKAAGGRRDVQQEMDVLFLSPEGAVVQVEVKRSSDALWEAIAKSDDGQYLDKFERWRAMGAKIDQPRRVGIAIRTPGSEALDRPVRGLNRTPRALARQSAIEMELAR